MAHTALMVRYWHLATPGKMESYSRKTTRLLPFHEALTEDELVAWDRDVVLGPDDVVASVDREDEDTELGILGGPCSVMLTNGGFYRYLRVTQTWVRVRESTHAVDPKFARAMVAANFVRALQRGFGLEAANA